VVDDDVLCACQVFGRLMLRTPREVFIRELPMREVRHSVIRLTMTREERWVMKEAEREVLALLRGGPAEPRGLQGAYTALVKACCHPQMVEVYKESRSSRESLPGPKNRSWTRFPWA
jgi:hypothetical protein